MTIGSRMLDIVKDAPELLSESFTTRLVGAGDRDVHFDEAVVGEVKLIGVEPDDQKVFYVPRWTRGR